mgnify:CR=1 FL=1
MHNYNERVCNYCGKPYKPTSSRQGACAECLPLAKKDQRTAYNLKRNRAKPKPMPKKSNLEEIETKARALGMSYGQYQAQKLMEYVRVEI